MFLSDVLSFTLFVCNRVSVLLTSLFMSSNFILSCLSTMTFICFVCSVNHVTRLSHFCLNSFFSSLLNVSSSFMNSSLVFNFISQSINPLLISSFNSSRISDFSSFNNVCLSNSTGTSNAKSVCDKTVIQTNSNNCLGDCMVIFKLFDYGIRFYIAMRI